MDFVPPDRLPDFVPTPGALLFNSPEYLLVFLPVVVTGYFLWGRHGIEKTKGVFWLALASLVFYSGLSWAGMWLMCGSVLLNFCVARALANMASHRASVLLGAAICVNLSLLGYYKYADFFITNLNFSTGLQLPLLHLALPLGISFFTFTQVAYLVDVYRRQANEYQAKNIREFWQRWHITLSRWLRDYLYIPLGGNRQGAVRTAAALLTTFLLGGLWHGPNWTFVIWGALHGGATIVHRFWQQQGGCLPSWAGWGLTFLFVNVTWVFFRADSLGAAMQLLASMVGQNGYASKETLLALLQGITNMDTWDPTTMIGFVPTRQCLMVLLGLLIVWVAPNSVALSTAPWLSPVSRRGRLFASALMGVALFHLLFMTTGFVKFIYSYF